MTDGRLVWFELYVADIAAAERFYGALLGWRLEPFTEYDPENYFLAKKADGSAAGGAIVRRSSVPGLEHTGAGSAVVYLEVLDLDRCLSEVHRAGGTVLSPRRAIGEGDGVFALIADPEGNVVGLWAAEEERASE